MYIFRKRKMLARLKEEARMAQVDPESAAIMDALDGREVKRNLWRETVHGEANSWFCTDANGNQYPVSIADCDEVPYLYRDKNGEEIHAGDKLRFPDGRVEVVVETVTGEGKPDLGINASNEAYLKNHPDAEREYYSLRSVDLKEAEKERPAVSEFNIAEMLSADDSESRTEAFVEALMSEVESDSEPWDKKGYFIAKALLNNDANALLVALCGWSAESLAKKAMVIRDDDKMFHDDPVSAEMLVDWDDGHRSASACMVDPTTHEVFDFSRSLFECEGHTIKQVYLMLDPVDDVHEFICIQAEDAEAVTSKSAFWFKPEKHTDRMLHATGTARTSVSKAEGSDFKSPI